MTTRDRFRTCQSCGLRFLVTAFEQTSQQSTIAAPFACCPGCRALAQVLAYDRGTVKWYDGRKGFGMLRGEDGRDVFLHRTALRAEYRRPKRGHVVDYREESSPKGPVACDVALVSICEE